MPLLRLFVLAQLRDLALTTKTLRHKDTNVGSPTARKKKGTKVMKTAEVAKIAHSRDIVGTPTTWTYVASTRESEELHFV